MKFKLILMVLSIFLLIIIIFSANILIIRKPIFTSENWQRIWKASAEPLITQGQDNMIYATSTFTGKAYIGDSILSAEEGIPSVFWMHLQSDGTLSDMGIFKCNGWIVATSSEFSMVNNLYVGGYFNGHLELDPGISNIQSMAEYGAYILAMDSTGYLIWSSTITGSDFAKVTSIASDDTFVYVAGMFSGSLSIDGNSGGFVASEPTAFIIQYSHTGQKIWSRAVQQCSYSNDINIDTNNEHEVIAAWCSNNTSQSTQPCIRNVQIATYDSQGNIKWQNTYGDLNTTSLPLRIMCNGNESIFVGGSFTGLFNIGINNGIINSEGSTILSSEAYANGETDIFILKFTADGVLNNAIIFGGGNQDVIRDIEEDNQGRLLITGGISEGGEFKWDVNTLMVNNNSSDSIWSDTPFLLILNSDLTISNAAISNMRGLGSSVFSSSNGDIYLSGCSSSEVFIVNLGRL